MLSQFGCVWPFVYAAPTYATFLPVMFMVSVLLGGTVLPCRAAKVAELPLNVNAPSGVEEPPPPPPPPHAPRDRHNSANAVIQNERIVSNLSMPGRPLPAPSPIEL